MPTEEDFFIVYRNEQVKVTSILDEANIHFIFHFGTPVIIAETMVDEEWLWYEAGEGETALAAELGEILEAREN